MEKKTVLTAAQPTGQLHLGNYFGAIRHWKRYISDEYEALFGVVNLHAITVPQVPADLRKATYDTVAQYIACGIDPEQCAIFVQSAIPQHAELAWVLGCHTPLGQLERMTQYKDKAQNQGVALQSVSSGLLFYPILMAADILLYNADIVPVGEDQKQHLELARDLAQRFNHTYSETFTLPEPVIAKEGARIKSLQDPMRKMSKSDPSPAGVVSLWEKPEVIRKKVMSAMTDSDTEVRYGEDKPGVSNLLIILSACTGKSIDDLVMEYQGGGYGTFKGAVADALIEYLKPMQETYQAIRSDKAYLESVIKAGNEVASRKAYKLLSKVYRKVGLNL